MNSLHYIHAEVNWGSPLLIVSMCAVFVGVMQRVLHDQLMKWGFGMARKKM